MGLKNIFTDYKNKKKEVQKEENNKKELEILKKNHSDKSVLKNILLEYKTHIQAKQILADEQKRDNALPLPEMVMNNLINPALEKLRKEFEEFGEERKAELILKDFQSTISIFCDDKKEYVYKVSLKVDVPEGHENYLNIILNTYQITYENDTSEGIYDGSQEKLFTNFKITDLNEEHIRNDFYERYRIYLMLKI